MAYIDLGWRLEAFDFRSRLYPLVLSAASRIAHQNTYSYDVPLKYASIR